MVAEVSPHSFQPFLIQACAALIRRLFHGITRNPSLLSNRLLDNTHLWLSTIGRLLCRNRVHDADCRCRSENLRGTMPISPHSAAPRHCVVSLHVSPSVMPCCSSALGSQAPACRTACRQGAWVRSWPQAPAAEQEHKEKKPWLWLLYLRRFLIQILLQIGDKLQVLLRSHIQSVPVYASLHASSREGLDSYSSCSLPARVHATTRDIISRHAPTSPFAPDTDGV